jgi:hypothetical protein
MSEFEEIPGLLPEGAPALWLVRAIGRLEGKLDGFLDKMETQDKRLTDIDERLRLAESHQYKVAGASGVVALFVGGAVTLVTHFWKG